MKVLSIRGKNLTSFAGDFALELDRPPLDRLGLFAITGATGAGKSTLLDALCLALFDRTPRLGGRGGVPVGRADEEEEARLSAYDVRGMLRRGSGEGFAEVDFQGKDGKRYRARWSVWRARSRAEGRFRPQEMTLTEVASGQQFGRTKGEVLTAIQERLGLSFDQFRRSALLAQNEFAAFLKADASERAELLERMTGTEVYSRLSIAAHEKNKAEQEELARRELGLAAIALMAAEERGAAEVRLGEEAQARREVEGRLGEAESAAAWHSERAALVGAQRDAEEKEARATEALEVAAPRAKKLEEVRAAESFRGAVAATEVAERRWEEAEAARGARAVEVDVSREKSARLQVTLKEAEGTRTQAQGAMESAAPALEEAAELDARWATAARDAEESRARARVSEGEAAKAQVALETVAAREEEARVAGEAARVWLVEKAHWAALAGEWPRWQRELERYEVALGEGRTARTAAGTQRVEVDRLKDAVRLRSQERDAAVEAEALAQAASTHAEAALGEESGAGRRVLRESLLVRQESLRTLETARVGWCSAEDEARGAERETATAKEESEAATGAAREAATRRLEREAALKEARRALAVAQATQGLAAQRVLLCEGEACPLCGATEHPYRHEVPALAGLVAESAARVETLEAERTDCSREEVEASARQAAARARATQAESRREGAAVRRAEHRDAWTRGRERWTSVGGDSSGLSTSPPESGRRGGGAQDTTASDDSGRSVDARLPASPPESGATVEARVWLEAMGAEVQARLSALKSEEQAAEGLARAAREARAALETQRTRREVAAEALRRAEESSTRVEGTLKECLARVEAADATVRQVLADVSPIFESDTGWEAKLEATPADFRQKCGKRVTMWKEREDVVQKAKAREDEEQRHRARAQGLLEVNVRRAEEDAALAVLKEQATAELARARAKLLDGRPTEAVRTELREKLEAALSAFEQARTLAESARQAEGVAQARVEDALRGVALAREARESALAELTRRLSAQGTSLETVQALLAHDASWCEAEARALSSLREAHAQARAVRDERR